jgi:Recombination endonuclease VII
MTDLKFCWMCRHSKPPSDFGRNTSNKDGLKTECRACHNLVKTKWRKKRGDPEKAAASRRKKKYGITEVFYETLLLAQGNRCAICKVELTGEDYSRTSCVDHDHKTGVVRGILCPHCNQGLGNFRDSVMFLHEAANYLTRPTFMLLDN